MRKLALVLSILFLAAAVFAEGSQETESDVKVIKVGHGLPEDTSLGQGFSKFKELVETNSNGSIEVEIYANGLLGGDRELTESVQLGNVTLTGVSATNLAPFAKEFFVLDSFFMFDSREHAYRVFDGTTGDNLSAALENKNMYGLAFWENGFRHLTNSKRIVAGPDDMRGIKMRVPENPVQIAAWSATGAGPTPMAWGELFTSLQQKVLDGQESTMESIEAMKFYEVQPYISLTGHKYSPFVVIINKEFYDSLSTAEKAIIDSAMKETTAFQRQVAAQREANGLEL
ncbi:MAG: TRAP transporter substrate-binding protein, partial [Bacteroidales bacterium]|nr:TRAP transporter substrate-binding protein [Bacteroidales bacterium]